MPKAWDEKERRLIKESLQNEGKKLFEKYGLRKTTVDEIVSASKISKGAFYQFYDSKELLYFDILDQIEKDFRQRLFGNTFQNPELPKRDQFKQFLRNVFDVFTNSPLYGMLGTSDYEYLIRKLPEEALNRHLNRDKSDLSGYFAQWIEKGLIKDVDLEAINGVFLSLFYFIIHREDIKEIKFEAAKELWIEMLAGYLVADDR